MSNGILIAQQSNELLNFDMGELSFDSIRFIKFDINTTEFKIILDNNTHYLEIIYDQHQSFRYGEELSAYEWASGDEWWERDNTMVRQKDAYYYYTLQHSDFISWYHSVTTNNSVTSNQELEHHIFFTTHEIVEVLSFKKPTFIIKPKFVIL